jgi:hypothetical protein
MEKMTSSRLRTRKLQSRQSKQKNRHRPCLKYKRYQDDETEKIKNLFATIAANTQKQLSQQAERYAIEISAMKQKRMETQNLLSTKTMTTQPLNDHISSAIFPTMTKACDFIFDGQP